MPFTGAWRHQYEYGSVLKITSDVDGRVSRRFETALGDSAFRGR
jgi:hypothetical protein